MDPTILQYSERLTLIGLLFTILYGGWQQWWVWGWLYREKAKEVEYWREQAVTGTALAEGALTLAERKRRRSGGSD